MIGRDQSSIIAEVYFYLFPPGMSLISAASASSQQVNLLYLCQRDKLAYLDRFEEILYAQVTKCVIVDSLCREVSLTAYSLLFGGIFDVILDENSSDVN